MLSMRCKNFILPPKEGNKNTVHVLHIKSYYDPDKKYEIEDCQKQDDILPEK